MTVAPVAVLALAGVDVASGPRADGSWPLMALDDSRVKWGRSQVLTQASPATGSVSLFDPTSTWAATADPIGLPVTLRWTWAGLSHVYFRGRVTKAAVRPHTLRRPDNTRVRGVLVDLTLSSVLVDGGNQRPSAGTWPAETFAARRARVAASLLPVASSVSTRAAWDAAPLAAVDQPEQDTALSALGRLFDSAGADRWTFDPDTQAITWVGRRTFDPATVGTLRRDSAHNGAYIVGPAAQRQAGDPTEPAVAIPASVVGYQQGVSKDMAAKITRITLTYPGLVSRGFTALVPGVDESLVGIRSLDVATQHTDDSQALAAATDIAAMVAQEASGWTLDQPMRWDTRLTDGGFQTIDQAALLLAGSERTGVFFLAGSWLPALGVLPVFGVMGGTIATKGGAWVVDWNAAPTSTTAAVVGVGWDDLDPSLTWDDGPAPSSMDDSVTYEDLGAVSSGAVTNGP